MTMEQIRQLLQEWDKYSTATSNLVLQEKELNSIKIALKTQIDQGNTQCLTEEERKKIMIIIGHLMKNVG